MQPVDDWREALDRLLIGDRRAFVALDRLITGVLVQLRAYDYRDEWDELRQAVLRALVANARAGRLPDSRAVAGYVQILTRQKMVEQLKSSLRHVPPPPVSAPPLPRPPERSVWDAVQDLADDQRETLNRVYAEGRTYQAVSEEFGIPLAAVTTRLRDAFASLRRRLTGTDE